MVSWISEEEARKKVEAGKMAFPLLNEKDGCRNGCCMGITVCVHDDYRGMGSHDDQELFYVLEGNGRAMVGGEEILLTPGVAFLVPAGVEHGMIREPGSEYCKVLWFHGAI